MSTTKKTILLSDKPTFQQLRRRCGVTARQVAEAAGLPLREEYLIELGRPVSSEVAHNLLQAFSRLVGKPYTLEDVIIVVQPVERVPHHKPTRSTPGKTDERKVQ